MNSPKQGVSDLPEILYRHGMRRVVISPGSRNAPLIFSFTGHGRMECLSITDERSAGYFALGLALKTNEPVGLICTSGTAALNYAPAIAEAFYQNIPLIILTADRPGEWIDQADGQTIRQGEIYSNYIKKSFVLPTETAIDSDLWYFTRAVNEAMNTALLEPMGPVQLNIPLREPLYALLPSQSTDLNVISTISSPPVLSDLLFSKLLVSWNNSDKKLIIFGADSPNKERRNLIQRLSADSSIAIIGENISNIGGVRVITSPERFFASLNDADGFSYQPDLLITVGHSVVTGQLKKYLRKYSPNQHWHIQCSSSFVDTYQGLTHTIIASPEAVLKSLSEQGGESHAGYRNMFENKERELRIKHKTLINSLQWSDLIVYDSVLNRLPLGSNLHLANSTPIRYSQLFESREDIVYHCNRGTSGIDGCISTAAGCAVASAEPTFLITGDISFIYDSNGLWNKYLKGNFKIVVVNNGGGNIFSLINPIEGANPAREFFETPHNVNIKHLAAAFGASHALCRSQEELSELLDWFFEPSDRPAVLEIMTDADVNTSVFKAYYKQIKLL